MTGGYWWWTSYIIQYSKCKLKQDKDKKTSENKTGCDKWCLGLLLKKYLLYCVSYGLHATSSLRHPFIDLQLWGPEAKQLGSGGWQRWSWGGRFLKGSSQWEQKTSMDHSVNRLEVVREESALRFTSPLSSSLNCGAVQLCWVGKKKKNTDGGQF